MALLEAFSVDDLVELSSEVRALAEGAATMAEAGQRICDHLHENLVLDDGSPGSFAVRLYKTHAHRLLPPSHAEMARRVDETVDERTPVLVLLASAPGGVDPTVLEETEMMTPLTRRAFDVQPMLPQLIVSLGVEVDTILDPTKVLAMRLQSKNLDVFVENDLAESALLPDEEARARVRELGVAAIVAVGGILPSGDLFLLSLFPRVEVSERVADLLRSFGIAVKAALIPHTFRPFAEASAG